MINKDKITISINCDLLSKIDNKIDKINFKNRSHVIESFVFEWLRLRQNIWAIIIANECKWDDWKYSMDIPKSLIRINSKTLIETQLETLQRANIEKVVIAVWHEWNQIEEYIKQKTFWIDIEFEYFDKNDESQKIIDVSSKKIRSSKYVVFLWDNYFDNLNLKDFIDYHNLSNVNLSIIVKPIDASYWYWNIKLEWNNIVKFVEKPKNKEDISFIVNSWIYIIDSTIIPKNKWNQKIEKDFFPLYISKNKAKAYFYNWKWVHIQNNKALNSII